MIEAAVLTPTVAEPEAPAPPAIRAWLVSLARRLGVRHYVTKPVAEQAVVRLIESVLPPASSEAELSGVGCF